jgi:phosphatidylserine/phosphatidylglycerophosphate/cardiolipin synthase-like enzyme
MKDDEIARRRKLTFAQAEGAEPLPTQLKRTEVSNQLRAVLWSYVYGELQETAVRETWIFVGNPWLTVLQNVHVYLLHQPRDEFDAHFKNAAEATKAIFMLHAR